MNFRRTFAALACLFATGAALAQSITGLNPPLGPVGQAVTIQGNGFAPGGARPNQLEVRFNGVLSTTNTNAVTMDTQIQVTVPAGASTGPVTVRINNGTPVSSPTNFVVIGSGPYVTNFTPVFGGAGTAVILRGVQLTSVTNISFNGRLGTGFNNATIGQISINAPSGVTTGPLIALSSMGAAFHFSTLTNVISSSTNFFVQPIVTGFSPFNGRPGTNVVITGTNFTAAREVRFGSIPASYTVLSNNAIQAVVPTNAISSKVEVFPAIASVSSGLSSTNFRMLPTVTGFSPAGGPPGTVVVITGLNLNERTPQPLVAFNGMNATVSGSTFGSITSTVPAGASTGPITVTTTNGSMESPALFYLPATVTSFTPTNSAPGSRVTLTGSSFTGATQVSFNGAPVPDGTFTVTNSTTIGVTVPEGVTTGPISVTTPGGTGTSAGLFYAVPEISGFAPNTGTAGTRVTVDGTNFLGTTAVTFGGVPAVSFTVTNNGRLGVTVPVGAQTGPIAVTAPAGTGTTSELFYLPPAITSFTPNNSAPGSRITITGVNFTDASVVRFNGAAVPPGTFTVTNNTTIGVTVPAGVTTGPISVTAPAGTAESAGLFYAVPVISGFDPTHGLPGTRVTINGTNFLGVTSVTFNGLEASSFTVTNNGRLGATVPEGAQTGPIAITGPAGTGTSASDFVLDYSSDIRVIISGVPDPVFVGSNLVYSVITSNSGPHEATNVKLTNTLPSSVTLISATTAQGTLATNSNPIIATIGAIPSGSSRLVTLTVQPQVVGIITNHAMAGSSYTDPAPGNNSVTDTTTVWPLPVLSIRLLTNQVELKWPAALSHFGVQYTTNLGPANWINLGGSPLVTNDFTVLVYSNLATNSFFRLKE